MRSIIRTFPPASAGGTKGGSTSSVILDTARLHSSCGRPESLSSLGIPFEDVRNDTGFCPRSTGGQQGRSRLLSPHFVGGSKGGVYSERHRRLALHGALVVSGLLLLSSATFAATGVALTVYNDNLALVRDTRLMEFSKGAGELLFRDVAAQIDATSVHFRAAGVDMLEQNFDYDLVSPDKLLQKYIDQQIEVVSKTGEVTRGTLLSSGRAASGNQLVLQQTDGSLRSILLENAAEIRYPSLPEGLITRPTLRWLVKSENGGQKETEVSYLTAGVSWRADYVLLLNEANTRADLDAWVTLDNQSGADYKNAQLKLIAGTVHRAPKQRVDVTMKAMAMEAAAGARGFEERAFFEYHLYTLQRPTDVLDRQTKQVSLFPSTAAAIKKVFTYDWQVDNDNVTVSAEFENKEANGLGIALPAGRVRVYQVNPQGGQEFIGEDNIEHTPKNEKVTVRIGNAFDIAAERAQKDFRRISPAVSETDIEVKLRNHKEKAVEIVVVDHFWGDWEIVRESSPHEKATATKCEFRVTVEPEHEVVLTYTVRQR